MLSIQELKSSTLKELQEELKKAMNTSMKIRIQCKTKHEKDTSKAKKAKRYVAQIKTSIKDVQMEEAKKKEIKSVK